MSGSALVHVVVSRSLGNFDGDAPERVNQVEEALEIDDRVVVDFDVEHLVERAHEQVIATILDDGVDFAVTMAVDLDAQVSGYGEDTDLLRLLVDTSNHDRIRTLAIVVLIYRLPPLAGVAAHEEDVIWLVRRRSGEVGDVLVALDVVGDVVVPQPDGNASTREDDGERDDNAKGNLLAPRHTALASHVLGGSIIRRGAYRLRATTSPRIGMALPACLIRLVLCAHAPMRV